MDNEQISALIQSIKERDEQIRRLNTLWNRYQQCIAALGALPPSAVLREVPKNPNLLTLEVLGEPSYVKFVINAGLGLICYGVGSPDGRGNDVVIKFDDSGHCVDPNMDGQLTDQSTAQLLHLSAVDKMSKRLLGK